MEGRAGTMPGLTSSQSFSFHGSQSVSHVGSFLKRGPLTCAVVFERFIPFLSKKYSFFSVTVLHTILIDIFKIFS